jgi:hypothetical protein
MKMKFIVRTVVPLDMESRMKLPDNTFWVLIGIVVMMLLMIPILEYGGYYG